MGAGWLTLCVGATSFITRNLSDSETSGFVDCDVTALGAKGATTWMHDFLYTKNISFFKDGNYKFMQIIDKFKADVVTVAAPNLIPYKGNKKPKGYTKMIDDKIAQMLVFPATQGVKNLVLSAFGCGAFRNNPRFISQRFKKQLQNLPYDNVIFAILDDHNSKANGISNFDAFKKTIK